MCRNSVLLQFFIVIGDCIESFTVIDFVFVNPFYDEK